MTTNIHPLVKSLLALKDHLAALKKFTPNPQDQRVNSVLNQLTEIAEIISEQLEAFDTYPYEFYEETGRMVSLISSFRIDLPWEAFLQTQQVWPVLNTLVDQLAGVVCRQAGMKSESPLINQSIDWDAVSILELDEWVAPLEDAAKAARKDADKLLEETEKFLILLQDQVNQPQQVEHLMQSSVELTTAMYVKNALAAIATDRAIAARQYFLKKASAL